MKRKKKTSQEIELLRKVSQNVKKGHKKKWDAKKKKANEKFGNN